MESFLYCGETVVTDYNSTYKNILKYSIDSFLD